VEDVLGDDGQLDGAAGGHVERVDLVLAAGCSTFHIHCLPTT